MPSNRSEQPAEQPAEQPEQPAAESEQPEQPAGQPEQPAAESEESDDAKMDTDAGKRALQAERARRKELEGILERLSRALPEKKPAGDTGGDNTDIEALRQQLAEAQQQIAAAERREQQAKIVRDKSLPDFLTPLIEGDDPDAMASRADEIAAALADYIAAQGKPKPSPVSTGAGFTDPGDTDSMDPRKLAAAVRGRAV